MRIRWTSVPKVLWGNAIAHWVGPGFPRRWKEEARSDSDRNEGQERYRSRKAWARITNREESSK